MRDHAKILKRSAGVEAQWEAIYADPQTAHKNQYPTELVVSIVFRHFHERTGLKALDLGCGWGNNLRFLRDAGFDAYGIEISRTAVDSLRPEFGDRVVHSTILDLPYPDDHFAFVLDRSSIQHNPIEDLPTAIAEAHRVLRPGGLFFSMMVATPTNEYNATVVADKDVRSLLGAFREVLLDFETRSGNNRRRIHTVHLITARK